MSLRHNLQLLRGGLGGPGRPRTPAGMSALGTFLEKSRLVGAAIFLVTVAAIVLISYVGVSPGSLPVLPGQLATVGVVADESFAFVSQERTREASNALRDRVPPVYRLDLSPLDRFEFALHGLMDRLEQLDRELPAVPANAAARAERRTAIVDAFNLSGSYRIGADDVATLQAAGDPAARRKLVESGLAILRELYTEGVHDGSLAQSAEPERVTVYDILRPGGEIVPRPAKSLEQALRYLQINLSVEGSQRELAMALFRIFRSGVAPNLAFDHDASQRRKNEALRSLQPVTITVSSGQTIVEQGTRVSPAQYEMLMAYRQVQHTRGEVARDQNLRLFGRILLVLSMVIACAFYIRLEDRETLQSNTRLGLLALVVIVNLALVRATYSLLNLEVFQADGSLASALPYIAPTALAPLIVAILIDAGSAIFMALLISIFTGVIYGNRLDLLVVTFLASMVAIFGCRDLRKRGSVVRAALTGGLTVAVFAGLVGLVDRIDQVTLLQQMGAGLATGLLTGVLVVGTLPVLESLFQRTTDITLLELTDFNHPLLRLMQLEAPGTYHHSLVVAQLAENACSAIGANPLLARVCSLFHDIGKTAKPEYFSENQRTGTNPHDSANASFSALVIKNHVTDGVELALKHHLPRAVIDVIQQHHGTSLIRYFYQRALGESSRAPFGGSGGPFAPGPAGTAAAAAPAVPEAAYRYDGPRPQFKESAVISLADAVEAASRSLRQVTPQHLGEMIDSVFRERIADGQLDEAPLTFAELAQVKSSFTFTLINMLHARVAYPAAESEGGTPRPEDGGRKAGDGKHG